MITSPNTMKSFAELVLFSNNLDEKLAAPSIAVVGDQTISAPIVQSPDYPGRPQRLNFRPVARKAKSHFPSKSSLDEPRSRGMVLHFFANHELLALELMALALLKWPDAPLGFRKGIVQTMAEEQSHLRQYLKRMNDLGVEFGESPVNSFFWDSMKDMASPMEYAAAMSMTFEQANLDFSLHFESLFQQVGDHVTAELMKRVRLEEIGHVKHGVVWFERWRPKTERLFKEWYDCLRFPITPARAKGTTFDREGRKAAGLPEEFIEELSVHNQSKGRPPKVFMFNPTCEQEVESGQSNWTPPKAIRDLTQDYESLMGLLAQKHDVVMTTEQPSIEHLTRLADLGFETPEFVTHDEQSRLKLRKLAGFEPWGWSPVAKKYFAPLNGCLRSPDRLPTHGPNDPENSLFSKFKAAQIRSLLQLDQVPNEFVSNIGMIEPVVNRLMGQSSAESIVFKAPFSSSGRGMCRIKTGESCTKEKQWISSIIKQHGRILAEPWLPKIADLSAHVNISEEGVVQFLGLTRFWTNDNGQYRGHIIGRLMDDFDAQTLQIWHHENGWQTTLKNTALNVGREAAKIGYFGPLGIDAFIYQSKGTMTLRPMIEINPRWSMGRIALALSRKIAAKHCGIWIHLTKKDLGCANLTSFSELTENLRKIHPDDIHESNSQKIIRAGAFSVNDPQKARQSMALLVVGMNLFECYDVLRKGGIYDKYLEFRLQSETGVNISTATS